MNIEGISIILDKSTLQGLGKSEIEALSRHYFLVVPPILLMEILGDLAKVQDNLDPEKKVQMLALKIQTFSACKHVDYRNLRDASLLGNDMNTSYRPIIEPTELIDDDGLIAYISESIEMKDVKDWQCGEFTQVDRQDAQLWKETSIIDLGEYQKQLLAIPQLSRISSLRAVFEKMDFTYRHSVEQWPFIDWFCNRIRIQAETKILVRKRWELDRQPFHVFSPYAYYCFLIEQVFYQGLANGLIPISAKAKAYIDLQYAYYFPYSRMFSSSDKFHKKLWYAFANIKQQSFVAGNILRGDLMVLQEHWNNCTEEVRADLRRISPHPPELPNSVTYDVYQRLIQLGVRRPLERSEQRVESTQEERQALADRSLSKYQKVRNKAEQSRS